MKVKRSHLDRSGFGFEHDFLVSASHTVPTYRHIDIAEKDAVGRLCDLAFALQRNGKVFDLGGLVHILMSLEVSPCDQMQFRTFRIVQLNGFFASDKGIVEIARVKQLRVVIVDKELGFRNNAQSRDIITFVIHDL